MGVYDDIEPGASDMDVATTLMNELNKRSGIMAVMATTPRRKLTRRERARYWVHRKVSGHVMQPIHDWTAQHGAYCWGDD